MKKEKAMRIAMKTMVLAELTGIRPDIIICYYAALEVFPDADLCKISGITGQSFEIIRDISEADQDIQNWWGE